MNRADDKNPGLCGDRHCGKDVDERCPDGYCRACHVSLGFDECCDGSWVERQRRAAGLPARVPS